MAIHKPVEQTPETIRATAKALKDGALQLESLAGLLEDLKFPSLMVTNDDQRKRAMEYVDNFVHAVKTALRESRESRGDFRGSEQPKRPRTKKRVSDSVSDSPSESPTTKGLRSKKGHALHSGNGHEHDHKPLPVEDLRR